MMTTPARWLRAALASALLTVLAGCPPVAEDPTTGSRWPYPSVQTLNYRPQELEAAPALLGRWVTTLPDGVTVLAESSAPRYLALLSASLGGARYLDLGPGASAGNVVFSDDGRSLCLTAAVTSPHAYENAVVSRALLELDPGNWALLGSVSLPRDEATRGLGLDHNRSRAYLLDDDGVTGRVRVIDLYQGRTVLDRRAGPVPSGVIRKGLVLDRESRRVFCLVGGEGTRSDFDPVDRETAAPELMAFNARTMDVEGRIPLPEESMPRAVAYDAVTDRVLVSVLRRDRTQVLIVDSGFLNIRASVELPETTSDLVARGGFAFAPGAHGVFIVDVDQERWVSRADIPFDQTGEMTVTGDLRTGLVQFVSLGYNEPPGIGVVDLTTGTLREVWH